MQIDGREIEFVKCNICGEDNTTIIWEKNKFCYRKCNECDLVYISPRLNSDSINNIYETGFKSKHDSKPVPVDHSSYNNIYRSFDKYRKKNNLLDVGCFRGDFLVGARENGWNVYGTEISNSAAVYGIDNNNIDIFIGTLPEAEFESDYFDVVTLLDVVEHLANPSNYLKEIYRILKPGGLLFMDTPNYNSLLRNIYGKKWSIFFPWHLYYFSAKTLKKIVLHNGFKVKKINCQGMSPISTENVYTSLNKSTVISSKTIVSNKFIIKYRKQIKPIYRFTKFICNAPILLLSKLRINIGSKLIIYAEKSILNNK